MDVEALLARPVAGLIPIDDARAPLRVMVASLAPGGAERIVLEWLAAERSRGREVELAVLHQRQHALAAQQGITLRMRRGTPLEDFVREVACDWRASPAPASTHLVSDEVLAMLWSAGVRTVPTVHNAAQGWRNDPKRWRRENVPMAIACAESVRFELLRAGCEVPVVTIRHRPRVGPAALDPVSRERVRAQLRVAPGALLIGAAGAIKPQKDYARAIDVLHALLARREAVLVILGGVLDHAGLRELDRVMSRAMRLGVADRVRLPGFVRPIEPWLAACDALLNVSRFEGLSMAVREALAAGLPVVATDVGGQREIDHCHLALLPADAAPRAIAEGLARLPVRTCLDARPLARVPRVWSMAMAPRAHGARDVDTIFVTANLNAGGAQRSLVNLALALRRRHRLAIAVCGESTHAAFVSCLRDAPIELFRPAVTADPLSVAESLLAHADRRAARGICFWNADAKVKLLVAKFAPPSLRLLDASPGEDAFREMGSAEDFADSIASSTTAFYERLDTLILKYHAARHPACARVEVIPNGVDGATPSPVATLPRFLVSGRIAPSKRLEDIVAAFALVHASDDRAELHVFGTVEERHREYARTLGFAAPGVCLRGASFDLAHCREPWTAAVILGTRQGSPNAVLEAMAAGIPVIANDSGGTRESVIAGETGWLLPEDVRADRIAAAMREAWADPERSARLGLAARAHVLRHNAIARMAESYLAVLAPVAALPREKMPPWKRTAELPTICASPASSR